MSELIKSDNAIQVALLEVVKRDDIDPERLERFLDLQIKMEERQAGKEFSAAMSKFQGECPIIKKTKQVDFSSKSGNRTKYDYATLDEIVHIIKPILQKHGLSYTFDVEPGEKFTSLITTIRHVSGYSEVFNYQFDTLHDDQRMNLSQRRKSALSYAKRAALENALGIVTAGADDDARRALDNVVTDEQLEKIEKLMKTTATSMPNILDFLKVVKLEDLSEYEANKAIHALKQKRVVNAGKSKL